MKLDISAITKITQDLLGPPFEWCFVPGGSVRLQDASSSGGTKGGEYNLSDFAIARCLVTNAQYQKFIDDPQGFAHPAWWDFSPQGTLWRKERNKPVPTAFEGAELPRTRVSWFDCLAYCAWASKRISEVGLSNKQPALNIHDVSTWLVRLPTEQEWQRAATGDTGWVYPWGQKLEEKNGNFSRRVGSPTPVGSYPAGASPYGVLDMIGNVWEWCLTAWGMDGLRLEGYAYRIIRGGAWNVSEPAYLQAADRSGSSPRGRLNDAGFRLSLNISALPG